MKWSPEIEDRETTWLRMMSEYKYDSYQDFRSGSRFVEALLDWLQQFEQGDREFAYSLLRNDVIFISTAEMQHLVSRAFPAHIRPLQVRRAARKLHVPEYMIWSTVEGSRAVEAVHERTLFVGLSDGARMDLFRRANVGTVRNDQVIVVYDPSDEKWEDLHEHLKERTRDRNAQFELIVLLDDFAGSGTTLLWWNKKKSKWTGKLPKFGQTVAQHSKMIAPDCDVLVHHYIGTERANTQIREKISSLRPKLLKLDGLLRPIGDRLAGYAWSQRLFGSTISMRRLFCGSFEISFGAQLSNQYAFTPGKSESLDRVVDRYYDPKVMTDSLKIGGDDVKHGFAECGLTLVMEHNTPNNSLGLLWAESQESSQEHHVMRALFRRRQRHF